MARINGNYNKLPANYLFKTIAEKTSEFQAANPEREVLKLGIGNTTEALTPTVLEGLHKGVNNLADRETYTGYGDEQGMSEMRAAVANLYARYGVELDASEVFVSDGAKPDTANLQSIFSADARVAVPDPVYPVYVDTNVIAGRAGTFHAEEGRYSNLMYMDCTKENGFVADIDQLKKDAIYCGAVDMIYLCSPNNPTSAVMTHDQLKSYVDFANENDAAIIFDSAYASFIQDSSLPRSIYEVDGAKNCAIEVNSLSKSHGFTGVRLGWTIVPQALTVEDGEKLNPIWNRRQCTFFNGPSNVVQPGGLAALTDEGMAESKKLVDFYMQNAGIIKDGMTNLGLNAMGGDNSPYIWIETPNGIPSWDFFGQLLNQAGVVGTPGAGFGTKGEGYLRLSGFNSRENVIKAVKSIEDHLEL